MKRFSLYFLVTLAVIIIAVIFIEFPEPPKSLQISARQAMHQAKLVRAEQLAPVSFKEAQMFFDSAMFYWEAENKKFILRRDYSLMQFYLEQSLLASELAYQVAKKEKQQLNADYQRQIENTQEMFSYYTLYLANIPLNSQDKKAMAIAKLQLQACILALENGQITGLDQKIRKVQNILKSVINTSKSLLVNYFDDYPNWKKLQYDAIKVSKQKGTHLIVVDKYKRSCKVYYKGEVLATFAIELGSNWVGDKQHAGDKTTPEGAYKILVKKSGGQTKFHKAFLIDYPNKADLTRFQMNIKKGVIPKNTRAGGDIELHGMGGKGTDWTDGCVALSNQDMDKLYEMVPVGTPIVIVGSTQPLKEVLPQ